MVAKVEGIRGFFDYLGVKASYYDLGRRIRPLSKSSFEAADDLSKPYPLPYLKSAWLGVVFWSKENFQSPMVWTLKLPLDEKGFLQPNDRDQFLQQLLITIGTNIHAARTGKELSAVLDNNPYAFDLPEDRKAAFHAKISAQLKRPASRFYEPTLAYLENPTEDGWQSLGIQGLADVAARWQDNDALLRKALESAPNPAFIGLAQLLEHEQLNAKVTQSIIDRLERELKTEAPAGNLVAAAIRGMSHSEANGLRQQALTKAMALMGSADVEVVAAIASRCCNDLSNPTLGLQFLELLAKLGHENFIQVISDLMALSELRPHLLQAMRQPNRSQVLMEAIGALFEKINQLAANAAQ
ncbi:DUF3549 family protein [Sessilibacter corallicola]|uniref:DUF3549 family protein n=1 Tax=Sessilibacter corallicola TaxID=2904075 RepID=A0ABQ0A7K5_9GAMM|nr:DUF3549 family protein [Sessilibacter corallicola]MCE2028754.1 DUF3549 family protein [Sessilibacter corallicola]